ncbi:MAG: trypsin-like peptidase domain-containing protein, partial [Gammaproteobacteria bacterium]
MATTRHRSARLWVAAGFGIAVASVLLSISFAQPAQGKRLDDREPSALAHVQTADTLRPEFADIIEAVEPSVVTIAVEATIQGPQRLSFPPGSGMDEFFERFFGRQFTVPDMPQQQVHGVGSGFVIDRDGLIVTNNHVIDGAKHIVVTLHDGTEHDAKVIGADPKTDLALLEIDADGLTAARFGDSDRARVGDWVVAIGNPFGFGGTATVGIISARGRDLQSGPYDDFLQIDAPINRGNSGGPVFNTYGEVIGVNTAIYSPNGGNVGIGFAFPARQAEHVVGELRENGSVDRGWLGVQLQPMNAELAESFGLDE